MSEDCATAEDVLALPADEFEKLISSCEYDEFTTDDLGVGPILPIPYLDLVAKGFTVVSRLKNAQVGGLAAQSGKNYILTNRMMPQPASFHVAAPNTKVKFGTFYFGFVLNTDNAA
ncbi:MAG: hypothetical protein Q9213_007571, partial [Squamulea squamosa]